MVEVRDQFEIEALPQNAAAARARVRQFAAAAGFTPESLDEIEIAIGEAVTNAILYGSPQDNSLIHVFCGMRADELQVIIRDQGRGFDPHALLDDVGTDALGGRGVRLMRALMHRIDLHYDGSGMTVTLARRLSS